MTQEETIEVMLECLAAIESAQAAHNKDHQEKLAWNDGAITSMDVPHQLTAKEKRAIVAATIGRHTARSAVVRKALEHAKPWECPFCGYGMCLCDQ